EITRMEATLALAAIIFTLLAMVVATSLLKGSSPAADFANARSYFGQKGDGGSATSEAKLNGHVAGQERKKDADNWSEIIESDANNSLKYVPGKARSHHLEVMMSKEELAEEQRVQREQLAAIFQLLKDNKETFGDVSEGDLEEQLRLYSI
uniref:Matrix-remodeling-associated protein 7 helical domain-containing protein n=1 Tax=Xiphophorus couchianus TaxID=32473 RepID=A0A3B5L5V5_9TELE